MFKDIDSHQTPSTLRTSTTPCKRSRGVPVTLMLLSFTLFSTLLEKIDNFVFDFVHIKKKI